MKEKALKQWFARMDWIKENCPFGPRKEYRNEDGRLHRVDGPAVISPTRITHYIDGRKHGAEIDIYGTIIYYFENIRVPDKFLLTPDSLTIEEVLAYKNTEVKYAGIKVIGYEKVLNSKKVKIIDRNKEKNQVLFELTGVTDAPYRVIQVQDGTPKADGGYNLYYLTVPPEVNSCEEAVAWTFRKTTDTYKPSVET